MAALELATASPSVFLPNWESHGARDGARRRPRVRWEAPRSGATARSLACAVGSAASVPKLLVPRRRVAYTSTRAVAGAEGAAQVDGAGALAVNLNRGLAAWRSMPTETLGNARRLPLIFFPVDDLLLLGHTKRMHLFEPRWVSMVDCALRDCFGVFGLAYFGNLRGDEAEIARCVTIVEVVACSDLEGAGRMVTVRGVSRARLRNLSQDALTPDRWGLGLVEELPELRVNDGDAFAAAAGLSAMCERWDLTAPVPREPGAASEVHDAGEERLELWTHESAPDTPLRLSTEVWHQRVAAVRGQIVGVPLVPSMSSRIGEAVESEEAFGAVACFYAALAVAPAHVRQELFADPDADFVGRCHILELELRELQGMASAKRALAGVFEEGAAGNSSGSGSDVDIGR